MKINKLDSTPLYIQISQLMKYKIFSGEYLKNRQLPSESEIQKKYSVSRITARKSYDVLIKEGIIKAVRGKGTYVDKSYEKIWPPMIHFTKEAINQGGLPSSIIISNKKIKPTPELIRVLKLEDSPTLWLHYFKRLRCIDYVPVCLSQSYIPTNLVSDISKKYLSEKGSAQSLFFVLKNDFNIEFGQSYLTDYIGEVNKKDLSLLGVDEHMSGEKAGFLCYNMQNVPVVYEKTIFR